MSSNAAGDRRWGTTRRSGMTILGKVAVPKPINLPSQRLENQGLDPNVEIVPKGTLSWGSKSSLNAWGTSSLSPRTESGPGSPSHLSNRPSSGGSVTRPSTAGSDKAHDSSSIALDSNSRPSSASGVFPSNQASIALHRPHSADTRPGSSQLSRFAESVSETSATWGQQGEAPTKNDAFSLTSGDFPSLGAEKESSEKSTRPQDAGPHSRPVSSSGKSVGEREIGGADVWRRDNQPYSEDAPRHFREEGHLDSRGPQSYPSANFTHQYDDWHGPPVNNHQGGGWYRGIHPYGAPAGPRSFHMDPFPSYPTQAPPVLGHGVGPRGNHTTDGNMFRPPMLDSCVHPRMQTRPGVYLGPVPYEGYHNPPMGYGRPSHRDQPFVGRPAAPHPYNQHSGQGRYDTYGSSVPLEQNEPAHSQETQRQYKVLLKPQDGRFGTNEAKREEFLGNRHPNAEKVAQQMQTSKNDRREHNTEASGEVQPVKAEIAAPEDPSLIQKIKGLNAKTRTNDGWQNASLVDSGDQQKSKLGTVNSGNSVNKVSAIMHRTGNASDSKNSLHDKQGDPATVSAISRSVIICEYTYRRSTQQSQGRADHQTKQRVNTEGTDGWRTTTVMSGSSRATLATNSESFAEGNVGDSLDTDSIRKPGSGISADPNDNQRTMMRELAMQRAQQRQKEEEERARDQRVKALAKLKELDRRSQVAQDGSVKNESASNASNPNMPEDHQSHSPALMDSNSDNVHDHSSLKMENTVVAAKSLEPTGESEKTSMRDAMTSTKYASIVGPTQQDNVPRDHDGIASKQKRLGYKQKQNVEKKLPGTTSPEVINEGVLSHKSDMPATSGVSTESTFTKRKNNRSGKKKHKVEETTTMNTTRVVAAGKETKSGDESTEAGRERAVEMELGSVSVPSVDIKVSGNSSEQNSSFTNEGSQNRAKNNLKSQHVRRTQRNPPVNKPAEKFHGSNTVIWAPVHPQQKPDISTPSQHTVPESGTSSKSLHQEQTSSKSKRVEIERYIAKPLVKEKAEQIVSKNLVAPASEITENVLQKENCGGEGTGILQPSASTAGKSGSLSKTRHGNGRQGNHGRDHGPWHQRGSANSTKALGDGELITSNQPIRGTVNYHTSNQTEQISVGAAKDQTKSNDDGWNDGWYMTPETPYSTAEVAAGNDQGSSIHGKQHASRSNKDRGSSYADSKRANKRDFSKAHMQQHSGHGLGQPELAAAAPGLGKHVSHTAVAPDNNRTGKHGGRDYTRDKTHEHQGFTSTDPPAQSQNRSNSREVQVEQNPNSRLQKNTGQSRQFGRGEEPQRGWGPSGQENMHHHHHQRPPSNRGGHKQHVHYEYKPVGSHTYEGEHNREQPKDSSQTTGGGPRYMEKGQGHQRHGGGQKLYQQRRNTGHGLTGEGN
ncbi:unnamed protein product [Cochlearia groenlandica]